jgi:hypothetical protein
MLASHTMGYAFQQASGGYPEKDWDGLEDRPTRFASAYPHVAALAPYLVDCQFGTELAFGLDIIISGLSSRLRG